MLLSQLIGVIDTKCTGFTDADITDIVYDSRKAKPSTLFVCLSGAVTDGHKYAESAYQNGCRAFLAQNELALPRDATVIYTDNTRRALALVSAEFFSHPERRLKLIGITGTKGKTTVTKLCADILNAADINTATIGTNGIYINGEHSPTLNTTPESYELFKAFDKMISSGVDACVIEVSSQAYLTHRVEGIVFDVGVFTNLAPDHIGDGEHPTFENYMECKAQLFKNCRVGIFNADDPHFTDMRRDATCLSQTYALNTHADFKAELIRQYKTDNSLGISFECVSATGTTQVSLKMPGVFNVYNALAAIAATKRFGVEEKVISSALKTSTVDGRFEIVDAIDSCTVIIDYAHNGFSMQNLVDTVSAYSPKRLVIVFGSVGSRTELRRKELGDICAKHADFCILTNDNPDFEDPMKILSDIEESFKGTSTPYVIIPDREEAIKYAIRNACVGDVIVFAGKGHEKYQLVEGKRVPFCERDIILKEASLLTKRG